MLSGTTNSTKNMQQQSTAGTSKSISPSSTSPSSSSIKNIKCEPYSALSPCNENADDQNLMEDNSNNSNKNNNNNQKLETLNREATSSRSSMLRQNSNGSVGACPNVGVSSPANGSDHSNSSNNSATLSQSVENAGDMLQDLNSDKTVKKKLGISNLQGTEEDNNSKSSSNEKNTKPIKDETDALTKLVNVKKEEGTSSPVMSPVGFGSIGNIGSNSIECPGTSGKLCDGPNVVGGSGNSDKMTGLSQPGCADDTGSVLNVASNETCTASAGQHIQPNSFPNNSSSSGNSMEYMQQQNHIFVFSTQLANKGAESVISGHYPTIIAYHCTQPATKNFLEEFFMKNPMKVSKLHRQNVMCNMAGGQKWMGVNNVSKLPQKCNGNMNFPINNVDNKSNISNIRSHNMCAFPESSTDGVVSNDLMLWEQTRNNLENPGIDVKLLEGVDAMVGNQNIAGNSHLPNKVIGLLDSGDNSIPSLQGVKVPDENLTPQQRQHREEQLAKLKKMNQFLFPENGSDFRTDNGGLQVPNQLNKLPPDGLILNTPGTASNMSSPITNALNTGIRNMPSNILAQNKGPGCNSENMTGLGEDAMLAADILHDMPGISCNNISKSSCNTNLGLNNQHGFPCGPNAVMGGMSSTLANIQGNSMPCHGSNGPSGVLSNSPEVSGIHNQDVNQSGMAQMEWSKLQNQFFEEKIKSNKPNVNDNASLSNVMCRSNSSNVNSNMRPNANGANCGSNTSGTINNQPGRTGQGPPPPYHSTQRSASVPIATQSPNPSSPNNPTSNLSMPSPSGHRTCSIIGVTANSPNLDGITSTIPSTTTTMSIVTTTAAASTTMTNTNSQVKGSFQLDGSPTNTNSASTNRNRNNINQFNSNPSTPLSRMSPKDLESFHSTVPNGDPKSARPSPQRSRTPLMGPSNNSNIQDTGNIDGRFPSASPGLNFPPNNSTSSSYKGPGTLERQNSAPGGPQFCRRSDNLPLNPNSNRLPQNKLIHPFDPISSLAQMSQQLTSCVSMNPGMNSNSGGLGSMNVNDLNMSSNVNPNMDGMMGSLDSGMDHCSPAASNNIAMPQHMSNGVPFMGNNCHPMMGPMTQRLLNPKMCGPFNSGNGGAGIREGPGNFHGVMGPSHRMMSRMPLNFGNFSPNIQVKASTPNTIQYMPVRPQNNNNNMRVAPSLDFLQRYANPGAANVIDSGQPGGGIVSSDPNKLGNSGNNIAGMNFFQNCNQIGGPIGVDQEEMLGHDLNMGSHNAMIRGMRPMRQHGMGPGGPTVSGPRMQGSGGNMGPQFTGSPDPLECNDNTAAIFNPNSTSGGQGQMFNNTQQKQNKSMGVMPQNNANATNNGQMQNAGIIQNEHNNAIPPQNSSSMMLGQNAMNMGSNTSPAVCNVGNGNINYKPFVGPASNDLKYPQQYLSFQQQLYATSTRNQQGGGNNMGNNPSSNSTFFSNK